MWDILLGAGIFAVGTFFGAMFTYAGNSKNKDEK